MEELVVEAAEQATTYPSCYQPDSAIAIVIGIGLAIATFLSYLPQMISLAWCKSSIGVSFFFMLLTEIGVWMPLVSGTIQQGYDSFACCSQLTFWQCSESLIPWIALVLNPIGVTIIYFEFVYWYEPDKIERDGEDDEHALRHQQAMRRVHAWTYASFHLAIFAIFAVGFGFLFMTSSQSTLVTRYCGIWGSVGIVAVLLQFLPQIYKCYQLKTAGSFSLVSLLIQCPGCFIMAGYYLYSGERWPVTVSYLVTGCEMFVLMCQFIYYDYLPGWRALWCAEPTELSVNYEPITKLT